MPECAISRRRAALLAHAMPAADRAWLLSELDAHRRGVLSSLLEELRSLGIPRDPALVRQLLDEEAEGSPERALAALDTSALPKLFDVLRNEPAFVAATLLRARAWPWRDDALRELGVEVREACSAQASAPPGLELAVVAAVWSAVQSRHPSRPVPPLRAGRWTALLRRMVRS